ncbi:hypothetical protein BS47DRAFT_1103796 [Hydnum rufescens UP504]|uniref:DUF6534 domain-containing protein n=1 Tax=Hydnum rufescens UP504 TaxID=1448309 RepID=A0A9P6AVC8_9AGAM|nr:hypothetical protein BS47DRAFT_1103796 [Hydnum rufescens UP504]
MTTMEVNALGGTIVGNLLTALCFGVLSIQIYSYYCAFPNDTRLLKLVVAFLWTLEAFQLVCGTQSLYWWVGANYGNRLASGDGTWGFTTFQISAVCASVTVQTFFSYRVYSLSANLYLGAFVQVFVLVQFGFGVVTSVKANTVRKPVVAAEEIMWVAVSWLATQAIADIVISTCMCILLRRRRTGFQKTDSVINRMVLYTINTGLATSVLSCVVLVLSVKHWTYFSITLGMLLGAFYSVTMLTNLHTRTTLRARLDMPTPLELIDFNQIENAAGCGRLWKCRDSRLQK